jgi:hypothetical protein
MSNEEKKPDPASDKRKKTRYLIGPSFPLKVVLALRGESGTAWKDWSCTLVDVSASGAHVQMNLAAVAFPDNPCRIKFSLGNFNLEIPSTVAHFVCYARYAVCGVRFDFSNAAIEKAYAKILEPVMIGATLAPVETEQDSSGRHKEQFANKNTEVLTIWRDPTGGQVSGFHFRMHRFAAEAAQPTGSEAGARPTLKLKLASADEYSLPLTDAQDVEARWLYRLAAANLPASMPADVRKYLLSLL